MKQTVPVRDTPQFAIVQPAHADKPDAARSHGQHGARHDRHAPGGQRPAQGSPARKPAAHHGARRGSWSSGKPGGRAGGFRAGRA